MTYGLALSCHIMPEFGLTYNPAHDLYRNMRFAARLIIAFLCAAGLLSGDLEARKKSGDRDAYISAAEIQALEASGHLTPEGKDAWKTRGGLVIAGRDPDGRTRLAHIMRHAKDSPARPKHGVFSLPGAGVIDLMDEAWKKVKAGAVESRERGGKVAYTIRFDRQVGYLGGKEGRTRGYPKLLAVLLVVKKGTARVITFFPM
jgi:hypothetical protein